MIPFASSIADEDYLREISWRVGDDLVCDYDIAK